MTESMIERPPVDNPACPSKTRSFTGCMCAVTRFTPARAYIIRERTQASPRRRGSIAELGITAVELLPVDEFDESDCQFVNPMTGETLQNFWGYSPVVFLRHPRPAMPTTPRRMPPGMNSARWSMRSTRGN